MHALDIVVGLQAHLWVDPNPWSFQRLASRLGLSTSQVYTALRRLEEADRYRRDDRSLRSLAFVRFATHGIPHVFPAVPGPQAFGLPTAHAAAPLSARLVGGEAYVWPTGSGIPGRAVNPLHRLVPAAAANDRELYAALALIDALRVGRARDRVLAVEELERLLARPPRDLAPPIRRPTLRDEVEGTVTRGPDRDERVRAVFERRHWLAFAWPDLPGSVAGPPSRECDPMTTVPSRRPPTKGRARHRAYGAATRPAPS